MGRVLEHFPATRTFELKEENLLSYEQFQRVFQREAPQASLLFNTGGAGYFAYCVFAPHILEEGIGTPLGHENATEEVGKYLTERKAQEERDKADHKPKVLVVDDSATIRQVMKQLLEADYDVSLAGSGVAAIRSITLNPPDLVLLDYEMPVCDGRQTLEMIRSEEELADLPVMFLTGRKDTQTMIQVMPLKPAGYLIKGNKPAELKKEVDAVGAQPRACSSPDADQEGLSMLISTQGRYSRRVLIDMAEHQPDAYLPLKEIARRQDISEKYLESIVKALVRGGMLTGLRGKGGGYRLSRPPEQYTVGAVLRLTEGSLSPVSCLEAEAPPCARAAGCRTLAMWQGLDQVIREYLDQFTIADLMQAEQPGDFYVI